MKNLILVLLTVLITVFTVSCDDGYNHYTVEYSVSSSDGNYFIEYAIPSGNFAGDMSSDFHREFNTMDKTQSIHLYVYSIDSSNITASVKINDKVYSEKTISTGESLIISKAQIDY